MRTFNNLNIYVKHKPAAIQVEKLNYDKDNSLRMATAVELLHIATLIHDDTVDKADVRRGKATASNLWGGNIAVLLMFYTEAAVILCAADQAIQSIF